MLGKLSSNSSKNNKEELILIVVKCRNQGLIFKKGLCLKSENN